MTPAQARVVNNCAWFLTIARLPALADALRLYRPDRVVGHAEADNDNTWLPVGYCPTDDFK